MTGDRHLDLSAEVLVRSRSGRSLSSPPTPITTETVEGYRPAPEDVAQVSRRLRELGFEVQPGSISVSITGPKQLFETVFGTPIDATQGPNAGVVHLPRRRIVLPPEIQDLVDDIVFPEPPEFH